MYRCYFPKERFFSLQILIYYYIMCYLEKNLLSFPSNIATDTIASNFNFKSAVKSKAERLQ